MSNILKMALSFTLVIIAFAIGNSLAANYGNVSRWFIIIAVVVFYVIWWKRRPPSPK